MIESYCGNHCESCQYREALNCPGCKDGPGHEYLEDCKLARCIISKGYENCPSCRLWESCTTRKQQDTMAQERLEMKIERERQEKDISEKAPLLITWLGRMFIFLLISLVGNVLEFFDPLETVGQIVGLAAYVGTIVCLLSLRTKENYYGKAGIAYCIVCVLSALALLWEFLSWANAVHTILSWVAAIARMVGFYMECTAHSNVLVNADDGLSDKWEKLWGMYIGAYVALFASLLVYMILQTVGMILMFILSMIIIVLNVLRLVYLHRTVAVFQQYQ